jgi:hypothetical protein
MLISMSDHYARMLVISPAMCLRALAGTALASTTGFEQEGGPVSGLVVLLAVLCIIAAFAFFTCWRRRTPSGRSAIRELSCRYPLR